MARKTAEAIRRLSNRLDMGSSRRVAGRPRLAAHSMADSSLLLRRWQRRLPLRHPDNRDVEVVVEVGSHRQPAEADNTRRRPEAYRRHHQLDRV